MFPKFSQDVSSLLENIHCLFINSRTAAHYNDDNNL